MSSGSVRGHARLRDIQVVDDCLIFGGRPLVDVVEDVGGTPFYAYDREAMSDRVKTLRRALPPSIHLHYAMKANPMPAVVEHMIHLVDGLDVASGGELEVAIGQGVSPELVSFAGPGKSDRELAYAVESRIVINVESDSELTRVANLSEEAGSRTKVAIRVNPDFELKSSGMKMSGGPKPFGIDAEKVPDVLTRLKKLDLEFRGFHIFSGSQNLRPEAICEAQTKTAELAIRLSEHAPSPVKSLNMGGGFGIPYFAGDESLELNSIADNLSALVPRLQGAMPDVEIILELGRYLVGEAGIYVCRVIDRKVSRGQVFLVTDGGLHHHLAASGNFGQVIRKNYPVVVGNKVRGEQREIASVVGPLCTPLDLLADRMELAVADAGDLIVVFQSGAYGLTASPTAFLSHPPPKEILI